MPKANSRYGFEYRLAEWAGGFSEQLTGKRCGFFVAFRPDGTVRRVYLSVPGHALDGTSKQMLAESYSRWFLYSPYADDPERVWLEWLDLPAQVVERWLGGPVMAADLDDAGSSATLDKWPESWRVIVG